MDVQHVHVQALRVDVQLLEDPCEGELGAVGLHVDLHLHRERRGGMFTREKRNTVMLAHKSTAETNTDTRRNTHRESEVAHTHTSRAGNDHNTKRGRRK